MTFADTAKTAPGAPWAGLLPLPSHGGAGQGNTLAYGSKAFLCRRGFDSRYLIVVARSSWRRNVCTVR
ncbi:MAG: hypothetical protein KGI98_14965 [Euryarchaeota archaeon]|nr:hypothetical protein [Euryarchaeota archaeon]